MRHYGSSLGNVSKMIVSNKAMISKIRLLNLDLIFEFSPFALSPLKSRIPLIDIIVYFLCEMCPLPKFKLLLVLMNGYGIISYLMNLLLVDYYEISHPPSLIYKTYISSYLLSFSMLTSNIHSEILNIESTYSLAYLLYIDQ